MIKNQAIIQKLNLTRLRFTGQTKTISLLWSTKIKTASIWTTFLQIMWTSNMNKFGLKTSWKRRSRRLKKTRLTTELLSKDHSSYTFRSIFSQYLWFCLWQRCVNLSFPLVMWLFFSQEWKTVLKFLIKEIFTKIVQKTRSKKK